MNSFYFLFLFLFLSLFLFCYRLIPTLISTLIPTLNKKISKISKISRVSLLLLCGWIGCGTPFFVYAQKNGIPPTDSSVSTQKGLEVTILTLDLTQYTPPAQGWDHDGSLPDLYVVIQSAQIERGQTPTQRNQLKSTYQFKVKMPFPEKGMILFVYDEEENGQKPQRLAAFKVRPKANQLKDGKEHVFRSSKGVRITMKFKPIVLPLLPKVNSIESSSSSSTLKGIPPKLNLDQKLNLEQNEQYIPKAQQAHSLAKAPTLSHFDSHPEAQALYQAYIKSRLEGSHLEAKRILIELISKFPKTAYGIQAQFHLF